MGTTADDSNRNPARCIGSEIFPFIEYDKGRAGFGDNSYGDSSWSLPPRMRLRRNMLRNLCTWDEVDRFDTARTLIESSSSEAWW
jgi:hypothetical protein